MKWKNSSLVRVDCIFPFPKMNRSSFIIFVWMMEIIRFQDKINQKNDQIPLLISNWSNGGYNHFSHSIFVSIFSLGTSLWFVNPFRLFMMFMLFFILFLAMKFFSFFYDYFIFCSCSSRYKKIMFFIT